MDMENTWVTSLEVHDCWDHNDLFAEFAHTENESTGEYTGAGKKTLEEAAEEVIAEAIAEAIAEVTEETNEEKMEKRKERNRASAALSRKRKRDYVTRVEVENEILIEEMKRMDAAR